MRRTLCMVMAVAATTAAAADVKGDARVWVGAGVDSNPRRDFTSPGIFTPYDFFGALVASGTASVQTERARIWGSYDFGGRKFVNAPTEDTLVQSAVLDGSYLLARSLGIGLTGRARDRRGAERDYTDLSAEAYVEFVPDPAVNVRAHFGPHRFLYWNRFGASFWGPAGGATASYRFNKRHSVSLFADASPQTHNARACLRPDPPAEGEPPGPLCTSDPTPVRQDMLLSVGVGYAYRGPVILSLQYSYVDLTSNSFGETFRRHRFSGTAGVRLPYDFTLLASAAVQIAQYPEGVFLSTDLLVAEDDENANTFSLKVVHPLGKHFDLDFKYSLYFNKLLSNDLTYLRMVGSLGVGWRW